MSQFENVFLSAKKIAINQLAVEVNIEKAKAFSPFVRVGINATGHFDRRPMNMFGGVFEQNELSNVDTFPAILWQIDNYGNPQYPDHLIISTNGEFGEYLELFVIGQMQQFNEPAESFILEVQDLTK
ncbi:hypothetical protein [Enterobacter hormaechei]|uniref:hypothetical protein n=1 Tax=Enterobacter hormaechei TaxID=158836 RepID=UPI00265C0C91|nr:hypothetical protein [Enterobacter hormaechei]MDO0900892.1 hypothetical protein [Enterobacter hormaechei]